MMDLDRIQGASTEALRDFNRRVVLNLIRTRQPISRADLARSSGLQRSTISLIVEQLVKEQWVLEGPTGRLPRGRRPTYLRLNEDRVIIGVDIRPTETTVALADLNAKFIAQQVMPTPSEPEAAIKELIERIQRTMEVCDGKKVEGIGISVPGRVNGDCLMFAPNLRWPVVDVKSPIAEATGLEVEVDNAANACVLATAWFDGMDEFRNFVVVTVSEGVGTGAFVNGALARGNGGMAGEFGHVALDPNGPRCGCGARGCWEVFASNRAGLRYFAERSSDGNEVSFPELLDLMEEGNVHAIEAIEKMVHYLGRGMRMIVAGMAPEAIIVVGDVTRVWNRVGPIIESEVRTQVLVEGSAPSIVPARNHGMARLRGTVAMVLQKHFGIASELPAG